MSSAIFTPELVILFILVALLAIMAICFANEHAGVSFCFVLFIISCTIFMVCGQDKARDNMRYEVGEEIKSTETLVPLNGSCYLGSGFSGGGDISYTCLIQEEDNSYKIKKIDSANIVIINVESDDDYRIEKIYKESSWFIFKQGLTYYKVYVPKDSIIYNYYIGD